MISRYLPQGVWRGLALLPFSVLLLAGCASLDAPDKAAAAPAAPPGFLAGYLTPQTLPNSLALLPPPPAAGSAALALDEEISRRSFALRDTARWSQAVSDAELDFPPAADTYTCALNAPISEADAPRLYVLLRRTLSDLGMSTSAAKNHYHRLRPFAVNHEPMCTPEMRARLEKSGSYPSGHTTAGWGWALILAEISPAQADAVLARGLAYGESRNVCNVHWHSDVVQGRVLAAGTVARLHAEPAFRADLEAAKVELAAVRDKGLKPTRNCAAEAAALAVQPSLAQ
jgi:acid phosphatase (class A)